MGFRGKIEKDWSETNGYKSLPIVAVVETVQRTRYQPLQKQFGSKPISLN